MSLDFKNNINNFKTTSLVIRRRDLSRTMSWTVFPRIYTNLQSKGCFQFCCQVRRPVISTIRLIYVVFLRNEKSLPKYLIHEKSRMSAFFISEKTTLKMEPFLKFLPFRITKLDILIFRNILHLEMDF